MVGCLNVRGFIVFRLLFFFENFKVRGFNCEWSMSFLFELFE